jgi:predicted RNA-binding protein with PIN domain
MAIHYIIDGYNVLKQIAYLSEKKLRRGREELIRYIEVYRPQGSIKNKVTIVFDGSPDVIPIRQKKSLVAEVIFTRGKTADEMILKMIEQSSNPKRMIVVTDDKELQFGARALNADAIAVKDFIERRKRRGDKVRPKAFEKPSLGSEVSQEIIEELKKVWLKEDGP